MQLKQNSCVGIVKAFGKDSNVDISLFSDVYNRLDGFKYHGDIKYDIIVNCAAMTDVNKIENDKVYRDKAYKAVPPQRSTAFVIEYFPNLFFICFYFFSVALVVISLDEWEKRYSNDS